MVWSRKYFYDHSSASITTKEHMSGSCKRNVTFVYPSLESLPRESVDRIIDCPDMTLTVDHGH